MSKTYHILLLDDDELIHLELPKFFSGSEFIFYHSFTFQDGIKKLASGNFDLVISDYRIGAHTGFDVLKILKKYRPDTAFILIVANYEALTISQEAIKMGAEDCVAKPWELSAMVQSVQSALSLEISLPVQEESAQGPQSFEESRVVSLDDENDFQPSSEGENKDSFHEDNPAPLSSSELLNAALLQSFEKNLSDLENRLEKTDVLEIHETQSVLNLSVKEGLVLEKKKIEVPQAKLHHENFAEEGAEKEILVIEGVERKKSDGFDEFIAKISQNQLAGENESKELSAMNSSLEASPSPKNMKDWEKRQILERMQQAKQMEILEAERRKQEIAAKVEKSGQLLEKLVSDTDDFASSSLPKTDGRVAEEVVIETVSQRKAKEYKQEVLNVGKMMGDPLAKRFLEISESEGIESWPYEKGPRDPYVRVEVSRDGLVARLVAYPNESDYITLQEVKAALEKKKVIYGIDEELIEELLPQINFRREPVLGTVIARGKPPVDGKDAEVLYEFELEQEIKIQTDETGKVDHHEIYRIDSVKNGDLLASVIRPTLAVDGMNVLGAILGGKNGKDSRITIGKNCRFDEIERKFYATMSGQPMLKGNKITVVPIYSVPHDVDLSVGNIDFIGTVIVNGNLTSGFSIKASEDIRIMGCMEAATVKAGGSVSVRAGFAGGDKGKIIAEKGITLKYCSSGSMYTEGDILIEDSILNSDVTCKGKIRVIKNKGSIIGGHVRAVKGLECINLGSEFGVTTNVSVGEHFLVKKILGEINLSHKETLQKLTKIKAGVVTFQELLRKLGSLPQEQLLKLDKLKELLVSVVQREKELSLKRDKLLEIFNRKCLSKINILGNVYPNVKIQVGNSILKINDLVSRCSFAEDQYKATVRMSVYTGSGDGE